MKVRAFFSGLFWGLFLILIGAGLVAKLFLHIDIPFMRIGGGIFFIYIGISIIAGGFFTKKSSKKKKGNEEIDDDEYYEDNTRGDYSKDSCEHNSAFREQVYTPIEINTHDKYNIIFGKGIIDLRNIEIGNGNKNIEISTILGDSRVILDESIPVRIKVDTVFGEVKMPNGNSVAFGTYYYETPSYKESTTHLKIKMSTIFAATKIRLQSKN